MTKHLPWVVFTAAVLALAWISVATAQTDTPTPAANMQYTKSAHVDGHLITWTLQATNSGNADSTSQTIQDTLPAGADWVIVSDNVGCGLSDSSIPNRLKLSCDSFIVEKRHLNETEDDFLNGSRTVKIAGVVDTCGDYTNVAVFNFLTIRSTTVNIPCPTTPTPVPPTQTPTTPITTPEPTTPVPTVNPPTSTPTTRIVPFPPNTGTGEPAGVRDNTYDIILIGAGLCLVGLAFALTHRRNK